MVVHNELPMGTDVHWHGVRVPNSMDGVAPIPAADRVWDTFTYEFVVEHPAIAMYHAHHHPDAGPQWSVRHLHCR